MDSMLRGPRLYGVSNREQPLPRLMAAGPNANLYFRSQVEFAHYLNNLVRLAVMSNRIPVWPPIDCRSPVPVIKKVPFWTRNATQPTPINDHRIV